MRAFLLTLSIYLLPAVTFAGCDTDLGAGASNVSILEVEAGDDGRIFGYMAHLYGHSIGSGTKVSLLTAATLQNDGSTPEDVIVELRIPGYTETARRSVTVPAHGVADLADLTPAFDFDAVYSVATSASANLELSITKEGAIVDVFSKPITIEPVNRVSWFVEVEGERIDARIFSLALITPDAPEVHQLLRDAADWSEYGSMFGYQKGTVESVVDQVRAVWSAVQARGILYTSVTGSFFDGAQFVRLPKDALQTNSANCVDGAFLFAAAFEALGMSPVIYFLSGHALMGVRAAPNSDEIVFVETTMVATSTLSEAYESGRATILQAQTNGDPLLAAYDLVRVREFGITPINLR